MRKILIVEDDSKINKMLEVLLRKHGYEVLVAFSGTECILLLEKERVDLILLDLMLPGLSGEEVLTKITNESKTPVICVSAKDDLDTKVTLIRDGADDYLTKPFKNEELIVRIEAVLRRTIKSDSRYKNNIFVFKDLILDNENHLVTIKDKLIELTAKEYAILEVLMGNPNKVFTKQNLFESAWLEEYIDERAITVHVSNLRNKLGDKNLYIKTVWGIGYKMQDL